MNSARHPGMPLGAAPMAYSSRCPPVPISPSRKIVMDEYGFSVENVCKRALALLEKKDA